jgi:hypothetical protein
MITARVGGENRIVQKTLFSNEVVKYSTVSPIKKNSNTRNVFYAVGEVTLHFVVFLCDQINKYIHV